MRTMAPHQPTCYRTITDDDIKCKAVSRYSGPFQIKIHIPSVSLIITLLISLDEYSLFVAAVIRRFFLKRMALSAKAEILPSSMA